jgi:hypothetical protein
MNSYKKQRDTYKMYYGLKEDELKGAKEFRQVYIVCDYLLR